MISRPLEAIRSQVVIWCNELQAGIVMDSQSAIGGGSLPGETLPTYVLALKVSSPNKFMIKLRQLPVPIIARIEDDMVVFDPRTIIESQKAVFIAQLKILIALQG